MVIELSLVEPLEKSGFKTTEEHITEEETWVRTPIFIKISQLTASKGGTEIKQN